MHKTQTLTPRYAESPRNTALTPTASRAVLKPSTASAGAGHSLSSISVFTPQAKLAVNTPGDSYEQEAEAVADRVMRTVTSPMSAEDEGERHTPADGSLAAQLVQRCACQDEEVQRRESGGTPGAEVDVASRVAQGTSGSGSALDGGTREFMEGRFGHSFEDVRVHTDSDAHASARSLSARAYTLGSDIVFRSGEYSPGSDAGKRLLAHELTHVVQQDGGSGRKDGGESKANGASRPTPGPMRASTEAVAAERGVQTEGATQTIGAASSARVQRFLGYSSKCSSEWWNAVAADTATLGAIAATLAGLIGLGVITVGTAGAGMAVTAPASIAVIVTGAILTLSGVAWAISAYQALDKCQSSDPDADQKDKDETKKKLQYLLDKQKELEQQIQEKQKALDQLREKYNEDGTPKKSQDGGVPTVKPGDLPDAQPTVKPQDLPNAPPPVPAGVQ